MKYSFLLLLLAVLSVNTSAETGGIDHVVLCWLNKAGEQAEIDAVLRTADELRSMNMVNSIVAGTPLQSEREIVDDSFDVGMVMQFTDREDLAAYLEHPFHVQRVKEVLAPKCKRILVYDIVY